MKRDIVAVDIAKQSLEIRTASRQFEIANDDSGFADLKAHLDQLGDPWIVCEASGGYERAMVRNLFAWNIKVSVVNPARIRAFAKSEGIKAKSDPIDTKMIMLFAQEKGERIRLSNPPEKDREEMIELLDRRAQLAGSITREKNRLEKKPLYIADLIEKSIANMEDETKIIDERLEDITRTNDTMNDAVETITQIKGVGRLTAWTVLAYLPEITEVSRNKLVSLAGLAPYDYDSGDTKGKRFIYGGRAKIRRCLYMAARSAAKYNDVIRPYVEGLVVRGKPYKSALTAAMRKILICIQSLLKNPEKNLIAA